MNSLIRWFINNPIAANLLMIGLLLGGVVGTKAVKKEVFPTYVGNRILVSMAYPGASPAEVEQQIVVRIEESIADLPGIFQITSESNQSSGTVNIEVIDGYDVKELLNDIKARVDAIITFPTSAERPIIQQMVNRVALMYVALWGDADHSVMKEIAYQMRDEMSVLDGISEVRISGLKNDEVSIEISEETLRQYNMSFAQVASAIRQSSLNVPAGTIKTRQGNIQVQTRAQAYDYDDFSNIVVRSTADGSQIRLGDIATIRDGFAEQDLDFSMNGKPGLNLEVKIGDDPDLFLGTRNARAYIKEMQKLLPEGLTMKINFEMKSLFDSRFNLLKDNALGGLVLVFIILMLFLRPLLAMWVVAGIVTTFAGAIWLLPYFDVSMNMLSMFAFLMVLGIVVDDAIIVGESVYRHQHLGEHGTQSAFNGTASVLKPVFLAVMSTIIFFLPMIDVPSEMEPYTISIFVVVLLCLSFSLVESLLILPSHLSHMKPEKPSKNPFFAKLEKTRNIFSTAMENFAHNIYRPALEKMLVHKISTALAFTGIFSMSVAIFVGGWINTSFMPRVPQTFVMINAAYPPGTAYEKTLELAESIRDTAYVIKSDQELLNKNGGKPFIREINKTVNGNSLTVFVGLTPSEERDVSTQEVSEKLKTLIGPLPEVQSYSLNFNMAGGGPDIALNMSMLDNSRETQNSAINQVIQSLSAFEGVSNVRSDLDSERVEVELSLKPYAETLGISLAEIATQVRQAFYGEEIQRIPRSKEDVKVMLRYPEADRRTLDTLDTMRIRTRDMQEIPLAEVANIDFVPGNSTIRRVDRRRNITISADVADGFDANQIVTALLDSQLSSWKQQFTGFDLSLEGNLRAQAQFGDNFQFNFLKAFLVVWAFFAIAFRSLFQPLLVMLAVPFGFVGALLGHLLLGYDMSMMSFLGFLACAGVVVNDNLVLLERINQLRKRGHDAYEAIVQAGVDRFRPIVLTSVTTFVGLLPILFERSTQAQFLIPMVVSLSFGVMFSSTVTLILVPNAYYLGVRIKQSVKGLFSPNRTEPLNTQSGID